MRALPGRESRTTVPAPAATPQRGNVADAQRARIRRATGELVAKRGYAGTSVELIVKRARVGFKTFYNHYANKEEAFLDLFDYVLDRTRAQILVAVEAAGVPWPERVALAIKEFFAAIAAEPQLARACLVEAPTAGPRVLARYEQVPLALIPLLREGRSYRPEAASLPETIEETLAGSVLWSAYQRLNFAEVEQLPELVPENIELVLRPYIGEREAARTAAATASAG
ncbi:MAG TPA: TetR/AcrR family transcriptional regulator [Solirubrobacterales bacterium]|nr:TetR/AcrR family transcriptional regulator [Solirubrobacterales bacterium]